MRPFNIIGHCSVQLWHALVYSPLARQRVGILIQRPALSLSPWASDALHRFVCLCRYLQDPCHVARFQQLCGVRGRFLKNSRERRDKRCLRGAMRGRWRFCTRISGPKAEKKFKCCWRCWNRTNVPLTDASGQDAEEGLQRHSEATPQELIDWDVGQEFIIENRLLFYLIHRRYRAWKTRCSSSCSSPSWCGTSTPMWAGSWSWCGAWVLFLGQSTKDVVRWTRPASPPCGQSGGFLQHRVQHALHTCHDRHRAGPSVCSCSRAAGGRYDALCQLLHTHNQSIILPTWRLVPSWPY